MDAGVFGDRLLEGETLLWSGQPAQGIRLSRSDAVFIPFSLAWGGFAIFWETTVVTRGAPLFMGLFGVPFVLLGLYLIAGRFLHDARVRRQTHYAVTNSRVLMLRVGGSSRFTALSLASLPDLTLSEGRDGRGTIMFGQPVQNARGQQSINADTVLDATPKFVAVENPRRVFAIIQGAMRPT